jgi:hypothetical protein
MQQITIDLTTIFTSAGTYSVTSQAHDSTGAFRDSDNSEATSFSVAAAPSISAHPQNASYSAGGTATALSVTASVGDGGTLSYKWQKSTDSGSTWNDISGATSSTYTPDVSTVSTYMYRCVVTNTLGATTASTTSNAATITVTASGYTVTVSTYGNGEWIGIYDGQNSSAPAVYEGSDTSLTPVTISSGYMFISCGDRNASNTSSSGGVTIINQQYGYKGWVLCAVTGNGSIYVENACYVEGTPITLSDRTYKNVEDITYTDELLVWNFDKGCFDKANPICILRAKKALEYNQLTFSDGSVLKTVNQHRIFNIEAGKFTYPMTDATPIGTHTLNDKGEVIELVDKRVMVETVVYYNIITKYHINCFASTILTSCRLNNIYPIENLKFIKDDREIKPYEQFNRITRDEYEGYRVGEQPEDINADNSVCFGDKTVEDYIIRCRNNSKPR